MAAASALFAALLLAGCTPGPTPIAPDPGRTPEVPAGLDEFYAQDPEWSVCGGGDCATIEVPLDYDDPGAGKTTIGLFRHQAEGNRIGSLVVNPGGPGASGIDYARALIGVTSPALRSSYDIIGFDPRGVGKSNPLWCLDTEQMDQHLSIDVIPDDESQQQAIVDASHAMGQACLKANPDLVEHMSSIEAAHDMDVIRGVLDEPQLNFLGTSYGTMIGAAYIRDFGPNVGRFVFNGAVDPALTGDQVVIGQARGFDDLAEQYIADCTKSEDCPLGTDPDTAPARLSELLAGFRDEPLPTTKGPGSLNRSWAVYGTAQGLYSSQFWPRLTDALKAAQEGNGDPLMELAMLYAGRGESDYQSNILQVINPVGCVDRGPTGTGLEHYRTLADKADDEAPVFGAFLGWSRAGCDNWPVAPSWEAGTIRGQDVTNPVLVLATTHDPATPYQWGKSVAEDLHTGVLLTYEGHTHTAYLMGSRCVDEVVDTYLLTGKQPEKANC